MAKKAKIITKKRKYVRPAKGWPKEQVRETFNRRGEVAAEKLATRLGIDKYRIEKWLASWSKKAKRTPPLPAPQPTERPQEHQPALPTRQEFPDQFALLDELRRNVDLRAGEKLTSQFGMTKDAAMIIVMGWFADYLTKEEPASEPERQRELEPC